MSQAADELAEAFRAWDKYPTDNGYVRMLNALTRYDAARAVPVWEDDEAVERAARAAFIGWGGQGVPANEASAAAIHDRSHDKSEHREAWRRSARAALRAALGGDHA